MQEGGAPGLKPALILELYAALKRRSSTVLHAFVSFSVAAKAGREFGMIAASLKRCPDTNLE
jgi:hypothetical protein